eukprot:5290755-Amphidinium_carterae.1
MREGEIVCQRSRSLTHCHCAWPLLPCATMLPTVPCANWLLTTSSSRMSCGDVIYVHAAATQDVWHPSSACRRNAATIS